MCVFFPFRCLYVCPYLRVCCTHVLTYSDVLARVCTEYHGRWILCAKYRLQARGFNFLVPGTCSDVRGSKYVGTVPDIANIQCSNKCRQIFDIVLVTNRIYMRAQYEIQPPCWNSLRFASIWCFQDFVHTLNIDSKKGCRLPFDEFGASATRCTDLRPACQNV